MKIRIITVGKPKLMYAKLGWDEYFTRLTRMHQVQSIVLPDKFAYDSKKILEAAQESTIIALEISGKNLTSEELADFLTKRELEGREISFVIGGPEGLPTDIRSKTQYQLSLGSLTLPHDLAMVVLLEALYRASTINAGLPYHK